MNRHGCGKPWGLCKCDPVPAGKQEWIDRHMGVARALARGEAPPLVRRYRLVIEGDDYTLLSALSEIAQSSLRVPAGKTIGEEGTVDWTCRRDEEMNPA